MDFLNALCDFRGTVNPVHYKEARWVDNEEAKILYHFIQAHKIKRFIEIGTANAFSACVAATAMEDPEVHTWDIVARRKIYDEQQFLDLKKLITF